MKHSKKNTAKWLTLRNFIGTQRLLLLAGCALLVLGIGTFALLAGGGEDKAVQKQNAPTLQQAQQEAENKAQQAAEDTKTQQKAEAESTKTQQTAGSEADTLTQSDSQTPAQQTDQKAESTTPAKPAAGSSQASGTVTLSYPVAGEILREYSGEKLVYHKTLNAWLTHNGIDISATEGEEVRAALAGEVSEVRQDSTLGFVVSLRHSDDCITQYAGLGEVCVAKGDKVNAGTTLGKAGTPPCEKELGVHLHFTYIKDGRYADPAPLLKKP